MAAEGQARHRAEYRTQSIVLFLLERFSIRRHLVVVVSCLRDHGWPKTYPQVAHLVDELGGGDGAQLQLSRTCYQLMPARPHTTKSISTSPLLLTACGQLISTDEHMPSVHEWLEDGTRPKP